MKRTSANEKEPNGQIHDEAAGSPSLSDPPHKQCAMNFNVSRDEFVRCLISFTCIVVKWRNERSQRCVQYKFAAFTDV